MNSPDTRPVVVGVDGGPGSAGAVRYAVSEARRRAVALHLVHVSPTYLPVEAIVPFGPAVRMTAPVSMADVESVGASFLSEAAATAAELDPGIVVSTRLARGPCAAGLVESSTGAQLLVIGRETRRGLERMVTGATTARVAARAGCDVVVVPSFWSGANPKGRIVAGVRARHHTDELLTRAFAEAHGRRASLTLVTAWQVPDPYLDRIELRTHAAEWEADDLRVLDELAAPWRRTYPDVQVEARVEHGSAADVLLRASSESDLLLVARRHHVMPPHGHLGGVAHTLLRLSDVPVYVVRAAGNLDEPTLKGLALEESGAALK